MTVSTEISSNEYTGNGVTTDFDYKFRIFKANQLSVITSDADGDNVVTLRLGTDYTVTGANKSAGGKVILTRPLANGHKISIARDIPITQETSFRNQSKFFAETHEDAFDYLTMIIQRIWGSLGSLYLKRPNILANWFDAKGYRITNLGKPKRDSDAVDLGTLKDEISGVNSTILKREKRLLRVDDMDISVLPKAGDRAGNVLTFDKDGKPIVVAPASGSAVDVLNKLSKNTGSLLVGGSLIEFNSVNEASSTHGINEGRKVRTYKHNVDVVSEWIYTKQKPTGNEFYIDTIDGYLILLTPNFASAGVKSSNYSPESAWYNRNTIMRLMRDTRFNKFSFGSVGKFYILGSVAPNRNNITLEIEEGVEVIGRYDDPSIPESTTFQSGEMLGFSIRSGYDAGNLDVTDDVSNVTVILNGSASTEYNEIHSRKNNNNVIGFVRSNDCVVVGNGGIKSSDHKGICFDGDAVNCHVDVMYIKNTMNEPCQMKGREGGNIRNKCSVRIGEASTAFGGGNNPIVVFVSGCSHDVHVDKWDSRGEIKPVLCAAFNAHHVKVTTGECYGLDSIIRNYQTEQVELFGGRYFATNKLATRAGIESNKSYSISISKVRVMDNVTAYAYFEESGVPDALRKLEVIDCDLYPSSAEFLFINETARQPTIKVIENNITRPNTNKTELNKFTGKYTKNLISVGAKTFGYNPYIPDFNYSKLSIIWYTGTTNRVDIVDVLVRMMSSETVTLKQDSTSITVAFNPNTKIITISAIGEGAKLLQVVAHN